jgi:hypothetical protein
MMVTRLRCPTCETAVEGSFEIGKFARLSREQLEFIETFIKCRGNIKEVERELGISYPTVRGRLDNVIEALGYKVEHVPDEAAAQRLARRKEILDSLNKGEITSEEALKLLKQLG